MSQHHVPHNCHVYTHQLRNELTVHPEAACIRTVICHADHQHEKQRCTNTYNCLAAHHLRQVIDVVNVGCCRHAHHHAPGVQAWPGQQACRPGKTSKWAEALCWPTMSSNFHNQLHPIDVYSRLSACSWINPVQFSIPLVYDNPGRIACLHHLVIKM